MGLIAGGALVVAAVICHRIRRRSRAAEPVPPLAPNRVADALLRISRLFVASRSFERFYDDLAQLLCDRFRYPIVVVDAFDATEQRMVRLASRGWEGPAPPTEPGSLKSTLTGFAVLTSHTLTDQKELLEEQRARRDELGLQAFVCVPMKLRDRTVGALMMADRSRRSRELVLEDALRVVASYLAQVIERQRTTDALRSSEAQLEMAQKMEAVGRLAGGVAHDFNNLLTIIRSCADFLSEDDQDPKERERDLADLRHAVEQGAALTTQLLSISRKQIMKPELLDLGEVLRDMRKILERVVGEDVTLRWEIAPGLRCVRADVGRSQQVLLNLVVNARDAMPRGGTLSIRTENVNSADLDLTRIGDVEPGDYVHLVVADTGEGMDPETVTHVFEPFFTTKESSGGTGLGLSTVYGIVKQCDGYVWAESALEKGTAIHVLLPCAEALRSPAKSGEAPLPVAGVETILLVEDEPAVRRVARRHLSSLGYHVLDAPSPVEAIELSRDRDQPIDLLLTDVVMPGMSGWELSRHLAAERPHLRVLFMSGYPDHTLGKHGVLQRRVAFLPKPFTPRSLATKVRQTLEGPVWQEAL